MLSLGALAFAAPGMLALLLALPLIYWLLRMIPPLPKLVRFPAIRLRIAERKARRRFWRRLADLLCSVQQPLSALMFSMYLDPA